MKRSGDSTRHCQSPTSTLNGCDLTPSTEKQFPERDNSYLTASKRHRSTLYFHNTSKSFSRVTRSYTFPKSTKNVLASLVCSSDFSKICWRVEIFSVVLRSRRKQHWVSSCFGSIIFAPS